MQPTKKPNVLFIISDDHGDGPVVREHGEPDAQHRPPRRASTRSPRLLPATFCGHPAPRVIILTRPACWLRQRPGGDRPSATWPSIRTPATTPRASDFPHGVPGGIQEGGDGRDHDGVTAPTIRHGRSGSTALAGVEYAGRRRSGNPDGKAGRGGNTFVVVEAEGDLAHPTAGPRRRRAS